MTDDALLALASRVASEPSLWRPVLRHDAASRWHVRLLRTKDCEVWLLGWTTGQAVALHDHGNSAGAFAVVEGTLIEAHVVGTPGAVFARRREGNYRLTRFGNRDST